MIKRYFFRRKDAENYMKDLKKSGIKLRMSKVNNLYMVEWVAK